MEEAGNLTVSAYEWGDRTLVTVRSERYGMNEMVVALPYDEFVTRLEQWMKGMPIQDVFPELTADEREMLITGCTTDQYKVKRLFEELDKQGKW